MTNISNTLRFVNNTAQFAFVVAAMGINAACFYANGVHCAFKLFQGNPTIAKAQKDLEPLEETTSAALTALTPFISLIACDKAISLEGTIYEKPAKGLAYQASIFGLCSGMMLCPQIILDEVSKEDFWNRKLRIAFLSTQLPADFNTSLKAALKGAAATVSAIGNLFIKTLLKA